MRNLKRQTFITVILSLFILGGCGLNDYKDETLEVYDLGQLKGTCKFDTKKLGKILSEDIMFDIKCLESNLNQFVDFVRREDQDYIERHQLQQFVEKFFPENTASIDGMLTLVFELNSLLLKDPRSRIHIKNLPLFFNIFRVVNTDGRKLSQLYKDFDKTKYWERRDNIFEAISDLTNKALKIIGEKQSNINVEVNITDFIENLTEIMSKGHDTELDFSMVESFLFVKRLFLGGEKDIITSFEFDDLLKSLPGLVIVLQDAIFAEGKVFNADSEKYYLYVKAIEDIQGFFQPFEADELILTHNDLLDLIKQLCKEKYNVDNIGKSIYAIKERLVGGDSDIYSFADLINLMSWGSQIFESFFFNEVTWDHLADVLEQNKKLNNLRMPDLPEYKLINKKRAKVHWKHFNEITKQFRLFQDDSSRILYNYRVNRTRKGYNSITIFRWLITKLMNSYGTNRETGLSVSKDQLRTVVYDLEGILRELKLWQEDTERFITEVIGGSDNFQYQANGDGYAGKEEASEYFLTIFAASDIRKEMFVKMQVYCPLTAEDDESFEVSCYRSHFFNIFFDEMNLGSHFPMLKKYLYKIGSAKAQRHLKNMENYSRIIADPNLPMTQTDLTRLIIGLSNVETLVVRYDANQNGQLKGSELTNAFKVFKKLIIQVGGLDGSTKFLAKSIFLYMVKKMEKPSITKLLAFHFFGNKKKIYAERYNVGAILSFFVGD
ncbi:MAG: hypothetical protein HN576_05845 [Bacteriovoracaceae bacterium]|jgi:hypothetical protein|nr:hypothetical protein [Bacteriovoracaceae bacterium]